MASIELTKLIPWILITGGLISGTALATGQGMLGVLAAGLALVGCIAVRHAEGPSTEAKLSDGYRC